MEKIKKITSSKLFIGIVCFLLGYYTNLTLFKLNHGKNLSITKEDDRIPVTPEDFDHQKMMDSMRQDFENKPFDKEEEQVSNAFDLNLSHHEDDQFVYYEIPINPDNQGDSKLNIEVKDGLIHITSNNKSNHFSSSMEQVFTIDPNLDELRAEVKNEKDKVVIKIPKKK